MRDEQHLLQECIEDLKKLKKEYEEDEMNTSFFIAEKTTRVYREYLSYMKEQVDDWLKRIQSW